MGNTDHLSAEESLEIISRAIQRTKDNFKEQSFYYIVWGWLVSLNALLVYFLNNFTEFEKAYWSWAVIMPVGFIISFVYAKRLDARIQYESYISSFLKYLWIVIGLSILFLIYIAISLQIEPAILLLPALGIGTCVSGLIMKFRPLIIGGILFFAFGFACLYIPASAIMLVYAMAIISGYLVPAYILKNS